MAELHRIVSTVLLADGTRYDDVTTSVADRVRYSTTARKQGWPGIQDDPDFATIFLSWAALHRTGRFPGSWSEFVDTAEHVEVHDPSSVDPTQTATPAD